MLVLVTNNIIKTIIAYKVLIILFCHSNLVTQMQMKNGLNLLVTLWNLMSFNIMKSQC